MTATQERTSRPRVLEILGPSSGGIRRHVATLAAHLPDAGWDVTVAGPAGVMEGLDCGTADVVDVDVRASPRPDALVRSARRARALSRGATVIHAHGLKAGLVALLARSGLPVVLTLHNVVLDEVSGRLTTVLRRVEAQVVARADEVIAVSNGLADGFRGVRPGRPIRVILPASEPPVVRRGRDEVRDRHGIAADAPLVVVVARLHPQKALDVFIRAMGRLHPDLPDLRALIVGDGEQRGQVEAWVTDAGLDGVVIVAGASSHAVDEIAASDVVAMSSVWEGAPIVVAEAMQLGRPMVSTDVGAVAEMLGDGGIIVEVGDDRALAAGIRRIVADPTEARRLGGVARSRGWEIYGTEPLVSQVAAVYSEVRRA